MTKIIGTVDNIDLEIKVGASLVLDITVKDAAGTLVPISAVDSVVRDGYCPRCHAS